MDEYSTLLSSFQSVISTHNLTRKAAYPTISHSSSDCNPRTTKFGGQYHLPPNASPPQCESCNQTMMMIAQLYIPSLPEFIQSQVPPSLQESLIVLAVCPECLGSSGYQIHIHENSILDNLVYHEDIGSQWSQPEFQYRRRFPRLPNSPQRFDAVDQRRQCMDLRVISGWTETEMVPHPSNSILKEKLEEAKIPMNQRIFLAAHDMNLRAGVAATCYVGGWPRFCGEDQTPGEDWVVLLNLCESDVATLEWGDCGTAQIWMGIREKEGEFKFTCSSH
jgi:hypothetical protein